MANRIRQRTFALSLALALPLSAAHGEMLNDHDSGPLAGLFGLPDSTESARLVGRGRLRWDTVASTASHSIVDLGIDEAIVLDGETRRTEFNLRYGISERLEIGIELPYVWHESGSLDSLIETWHDVFSLPDGFRAQQPSDVLQFRYIDRSVERINLERNTRGLGDLRLVAGWQLGAGDEHRYALRVGVKLPTGDSAALLGSGGTDVSVGLAGQFDEWLGQPRLDAYFMASAIRIGKPDLLADRYRDVGAHLAFGVGADLTEHLELRAQAAVRSALYDSEIGHLGGLAAALTIGANVRLGRRWRLSLAVAEDIKVESAPDVAFQLGLHYRQLR